MKTIIFLILLCLIMSCEKQNNIIKLQNDFECGASYVKVQDGNNTIYVDEIYPGKTSEEIEVNSDRVVVNYYITEGHFIDTFEVKNGITILHLKNKN